MLALAAIISVSSKLGYLLPAIIGLESMGVPSPGETALVAAAVLASQGKLEIWLVILIGITSAIVGDNIGYALGRRFGREVLEAPGPFYMRRLLIIRYGDRFFEQARRQGRVPGPLGRVGARRGGMAGGNQPDAASAISSSGTRSGAITWGITYGLVGYFLGKSAARVLSEVGIAGRDPARR